jgi:hypothetical protein
MEPSRHAQMLVELEPRLRLAPHDAAPDTAV